MPWLHSVSDLTYMDNTLTQWALLIAATLVLYTVFMTAAKVVVGRLEKYAKRTNRHWDDVAVCLMKRVSKLFVVFGLLYLSASALDFSDRSLAFFKNAFKVAVFFQAAILGNELIAVSLKRHVNLAALSAVRITANFLLYTILFLLLLDNLGVNITALVTGLGIGGIAIALAVQNILGDIFASLTIVLDKPFEIGDFIIVGEKMGTVESIGLKTSRIKSLSGEQLVFPNKKLVETELQNFKRMQTRRIEFNFGVEYSCTTEQLKRVPEIIKEIIAAIEIAKLDRVHLKSFGESSIDYQVVYIMQTAEYNTYMDVQQDINLQMFDRFATEGIEFAFPTRTLIVRNEEIAADQAAASTKNAGNRKVSDNNFLS